MPAARARLGVEATRRMLVTVRRAEPRMGLEQLLRAVTLLEDDVALAVVGGGLLSDELRRLTGALGLDGRVLFVGAVEEEELHDWYRAADLFVLPTAAYEGFGMVTIEALASGTPVVGTPVGATPELLAPLDPRLVARGADAASLATAIREALGFGDKDLRVRCRDYALGRFGWETVVTQWERALTETVKSSGRTGRSASTR
jgi:glycosyltransferase involved in cell wall biosynthesis